MKIILSGALAISLLLSSSCSNTPGKQAEDDYTFGLCLVSVENINTDFKSTIQQLSEAGVKHIELMNYFGGGQYGMTAEELKAFLDENGISVLSSNTMGGSVDVENEEEYLQRWGNLLKEHALLGSKYVSMTANLYWGDIDRVKKICETLNKIGAMANGYGIKFLYHLHNIEYSTIIDTDIRAVDYMLANTDPELVNFQFDVFWSQMGDQNPVEFLEEHSDRIPCLHFKDYYWLSDDSDTFAGGYKPIFDTFYKNGGKDVILDMEPYMTLEAMEAKVLMHAGIMHSTSPWPTPGPARSSVRNGGNRPPHSFQPGHQNADSLNSAREQSLANVLKNVEYIKSKPYIHFK